MALSKPSSHPFFSSVLRDTGLVLHPLRDEWGGAYSWDIYLYRFIECSEVRFPSNHIFYLLCVCQGEMEPNLRIPSFYSNNKSSVHGNPYLCLVNAAALGDNGFLGSSSLA